MQTADLVLLEGQKGEELAGEGHWLTHTAWPLALPQGARIAGFKASVY